MFTETIDRALVRHEFSNATVAFVHDEDATDPIEDFDYEFLGISRNERNSISSDGGSWLAMYDDLIDEREDALCEVAECVRELRHIYGDRWAELINQRDGDRVIYATVGITSALQEYDRAVLQLEEFAYFKLQAKDEYGWPEFRIAIHKPTAERVAGRMGAWQDFAQGVVDTYAAWAEGSVYMIGAETSDGETDYMGGIYGDIYDEDFARTYAEYMGYDVGQSLN